MVLKDSIMIIEVSQVNIKIVKMYSDITFIWYQVRIPKLKKKLRSGIVTWKNRVGRLGIVFMWTLFLFEKYPHFQHNLFFELLFNTLIDGVNIFKNVMVGSKKKDGRLGPNILLFMYALI